MKISEALSEVELLYVETSPFIYFTEKRPVYAGKMRSIFRWLDEQRLDVITSTISLSECLTKPLRDGDSALVTTYSEMFESTRGLSMMPVDAAVAKRSAELRASYGLKTPDALHVATALISRCNAFLTNDLALKRISEIRVLVLDELEIDTP
jgi:predicted nucleic acid-binding protein